MSAAFSLADAAAPASNRRGWVLSRRHDGAVLGSPSSPPLGGAGPARSAPAGAALFLSRGAPGAEAEPVVLARDLVALLITAVNQAGGQRAFADATGISQALVSQTLAGKREPCAAIGNALGLLPLTIYRTQKGAGHAR